jgi:hypothetical protein
MTELQPDQLRKVKADLVEISGRLNVLANDFQQLAAALPADLSAAGAAVPAQPMAAAPQPQYAGVATLSQLPGAALRPPAPPASWPPPPPMATPSYGIPVRSTVIAPQPVPVAVRPAPVRRPRRKVSIAEIFSILGSAITLLGVAFVLLLPADGVLSPTWRAGIGLGLAAVAVGVALWQHRAEPGNIGSQALMATGVAAAFLSVFAISSLFRNADGAPLLLPLAGVVLAGVISLGGVAVARWWRSQWLAVLAVLGSLVLAPYLGGDQPLPTMAFMLVMTLVTAAFQHKLDWVALLVARVLPTALYFGFMLIPGGRVPPVSPLVGLGLAFVLAAGGLGIAVLHQQGSQTIRAVAVGALVTMTAPMMLAIWTPDQVLSVALAAALGLLLAAVGLLPSLFADQLRSVAVPLGALFILFSVVRLTDGKYLGYVFFALSAAYFAVAASTRFKPVMVVAWLLTFVGVVHWLPALVGVFYPMASSGVELVAESVLGLVATLLGSRALRAFRENWGSGLTYLSWAASVAFGSVAVIIAGSVIGARTGLLVSGFQTAHAIVTVSWLLLAVLLLRLGLRRDADSLVSVRLAIALAGAAVLKLFLFDLSTLPDLVRALAFLVVGVLMLIIGTWYHKQLEKVQRTSPSAPVSPAVPAATPAPVAAATSVGSPESADGPQP